MLLCFVSSNQLTLHKVNALAIRYAAGGALRAAGSLASDRQQARRNIAAECQD